MEVKNQQTSINDYAVAKALNEYVRKIVVILVVADAFDVPEDYEIKELNRAYILLTDELQKLYESNATLSAIRPEPIWRHFDVLKTSTWQILNEYLEDENNDTGEAHIARIERLCILSDSETPAYSLEQKKLVEYTDIVTRKYTKMIDQVDAENKAKKEENHQIAEYILTYKPDGSILINDVLKLKKAHAGSTTERLLEQALKNPNVLFKPDLKQTSRNISTVLNGAGFTPTLRQLFFPIVSNSKGIFFRPIISREQADADNIGTKELDLTLKELGAITEPKSSS